MPDLADNPLNALVLTAMMQALDQQKRDELIRQALEALITPGTRDTGYGRSEKTLSKLEHAFHYAVENVARQIVNETVQTDEYRTKIRHIVEQGFVKFLEVDSKKLGEAMAEGLVKAIADKYR